MSRTLPWVALGAFVVGLARAQPRDGGAVGRGGARRLRSTSSPPGRTCCWRLLWRWRSSARAHCRSVPGPTGSRCSTRRSSSSTGCCRRAGWATARRRRRGQLFAARHDLIPVVAYFLGRLLVLTPTAWRRLSLALVGVAVGADRLGARRRLPRAAPVVARLGGARVVPGAARAHLRRPLRAAGELGLQHG